MDIIEAIQKRRSVRAYKPKPVKKEIIQEILQIAVRAPSGMNTQPWRINIVNGEVLEKIRLGNVEMLASGKVPQTDLPMKTFEGEYKMRQVDLAKELFQILGIARDDKQKRDEWTKQGFIFFNAPAAIIISAEKSLDSAISFSDLGGLAQTICLVALSYGIGTCIMGQGVMYPQVIRKYLNIPETENIHICITMGYPESDAPVNTLRTKREPLEKNTRWFGFD